MQLHHRPMAVALKNAVIADHCFAELALLELGLLDCCIYVRVKNFSLFYKRKKMCVSGVRCFF